MIYLETALQFMQHLPDPETYPEDVKTFKAKEEDTADRKFKHTFTAKFEKKTIRGKVEWVLMTGIIMHNPKQ